MTDEQLARLRELAAQNGKSVPEYVRLAVELCLQPRQQSDRRALRRRTLELAGKFRSGLHDVAERHDYYLAEADHDQ